jgi:TonB family protein
LLASLAVHLPVYEVLGVLADSVLNDKNREPESTTVEFELPPLPGAPLPEDEALEAKKEPEPAEPAPPEKRAEKPKEPKLTDKPKPVEEKKQVAEVKPVPAEPQAPVPPPQQIENAQSVTQKSDDPNVPPPENPQFVAEENRRVLEETVAEMRNMETDDAVQEAGAQLSASAEAKPGNADDSESAQDENVKGEQEAAAREIADATERPQTGEQQAQAAQEAAAPAPEPVQHASAGEQAREAQTPAEMEEVKINDGTGTFVIRRVKPVEGKGVERRAASDGAVARDGAPGVATPGRPNLRLSFSQFEDTFGADSVQEARERYAEQRRSRSPGQSREVIWKKFRGAIENYLPKVRPGNQTALNTAASPFAAYLAIVHRQIHVHFADQFLRGLPMAGSPMSDPALITTLEIVINGDGTLETVGVARSSGFLPFDYGAFSSVQKAAPFPAPPTKILSSDGRAYMHWAFHRSERQCGTFNAQPYILKDVGPPKAPEPADQGGEQRPPSGPAPMPGEGELGMLPRRSLVPGERAPFPRPSGKARRGPPLHEGRFAPTLRRRRVALHGDG